MLECGVARVLPVGAAQPDLCWPARCNQIYAGLLDASKIWPAPDANQSSHRAIAFAGGMRGIMFYRLGILGWDQPDNAVRAALNRSWVSDTLLQVLGEVTPHLPAILRGALVGVDGAPRPHTNCSEDIVSARLYEEGPGSGCILLIALVWNNEHGNGPPSLAGQFSMEESRFPVQESGFPIEES